MCFGTDSVLSVRLSNASTRQTASSPSAAGLWQETENCTADQLKSHQIGLSSEDVISCKTSNTLCSQRWLDRLSTSWWDPECFHVNTAHQPALVFLIKRFNLKRTPEGHVIDQNQFQLLRRIMKCGWKLQRKLVSVVSHRPAVYSTGWAHQEIIQVFLILLRDFFFFARLFVVF